MVDVETWLEGQPLPAGPGSVRCVLTITILNENDELTRPGRKIWRPEDWCPKMAMVSMRFP